MKLPAKMPDTAITIQVDSREQHPYEFGSLRTELVSLPTGDYSVAGVDVVVERKEFGDLLGCIGRDRRRFDKEIKRMLAYKSRAIVVEASWQDVEAGQWRGKLTVPQVRESILGWIGLGVPVLMLGNRQRAQEYTERLLRRAAVRAWKDARTFANAID